MTGRKFVLKSTVWTRRKKETFKQNRMKKQEFKELSDEEIDNLSDAVFKTLVIRMLTEMIEFVTK